MVSFDESRESDGNRGGGGGWGGSGYVGGSGYEGNDENVVKSGDGTKSEKRTEEWHSAMNITVHRREIARKWFGLPVISNWRELPC